MDPRKYSKQAFEKLEQGSPELQKLLWELDRDVNAELHAAVLERFREITVVLNSAGHGLRESPHNIAGDINFRDGPREGYDLRLGCDTVISAGFRSTADCSASIEAQLRWEREATEQAAAAVDGNRRS